MFAIPRGNFHQYAKFCMFEVLHDHIVVVLLFTKSDFQKGKLPQFSSIQKGFSGNKNLSALPKYYKNFFFFLI